MTTLRSNAKQILVELYIIGDNADNGISFYEWVQSEAENDPDFYRWLFSDGNIDDFGANMSDDQIFLAKEFFDALPKNA